MPPSQPDPESARPLGRLAGKRIALCVSGSVAAYKAVLLLRLLLKEGARVETLLTRTAARFVGSATFAGLSGSAPLTDMFAEGTGGEVHVDVAARSDLLLLVPATADLLARLAQGRADDLVTATVLCARCPVLAAPAMHPAMWSHPATQRNVARLLEDARLELVGPVFGEVASGDHGLGRMIEPEAILDRAAARLAPQDLSGRHVVVTAGPTLEDIDPVRFLGNRSSGKMGFAIAERARARGARVTLITGPVALPTPDGVERVDVRGAHSMRDALWDRLGQDLRGADVLVMCAAVGDFRPQGASTTKLKREQKKMSLELVQNPDILAEVGQARSGSTPLLVGFAVEADEPERVLQYARGKLTSKRVDLVVANHASDAFGKDDNRATFVTAGGDEALPLLPKRELADRLLDWVALRTQKSH
ncbi:MAG TPA: bifunctional phosphopantothenoylcysteine decarboxylase/phosphopantothenate--cysteine ligase CoaBC [Polyangiaceae bacterium]|nr:bifunctional phosphopantothenoylcysteine decarboxylase/phosphopantothenate--cysteine ligase CoaBC [Polyangiaceae bacterium]